MNSFIKLTDESIMPWGKYKGETLENIPASYLLWLEDNIKSDPKTNDQFRNGLIIYCEENRFVLNNQNK